MNGFIEVDINGNKTGLKFGYPAIKEFTLATIANKDAYYAGDNFSDLGIAKLIHCAYKNHCLLLETAPVLTLAGVNEWVEEAMDNEKRLTEIAKVLEVWADSRYTKLAVNKMKEEKKSQSLVKKATKKKTQKSSLKELKPSSVPLASEAGS